MHPINAEDIREQIRQTKEALAHIQARPGQATEPECLVGIGGAPMRPRTMPATTTERKETPIASGFLDYFPDAVLAVARLSYAANEQHNAGKPMHWARDKSTDEADALMRHFVQRGSIDEDGHRHSAKAAWRALALLQKEIEGSL